MPLLVNDDRSAGQGSARRRVIGRSALVVVDDSVTLGDLDAELVHAAAAADLPVGCRQQEAVATDAVDRAGALVLRTSTGDDQPLVDLGVEVEVTGLELELGAARGHCGALEVLRHEADVRPACGSGVQGVRAGG